MPVIEFVTRMGRIVERLELEGAEVPTGVEEEALMASISPSPPGIGKRLIRVREKTTPQKAKGPPPLGQPLHEPERGSDSDF